MAQPDAGKRIPGPRTAVVPAPVPGTDSTPKEARWQREDVAGSSKPAAKQPAAKKPKVELPAARKPPVTVAKRPAATQGDSTTPAVETTKPKNDPAPPAKPVEEPPSTTPVTGSKSSAPVVPATQAAPVVESPETQRVVAGPPATSVQPAVETSNSTGDGSDGDSAMVESRSGFGRRERFRARRVRRLVRHVDPWSVFKLTLVLNVCMWFIFLVAGVTMWSVARSSGTIENLEKFVAQSFSLTAVTIDADLLFRVFSLIGLIITLALTGAAVIGSILFNLISDLIGGVWVSVIEEESAEPV